MLETTLRSFGLSDYESAILAALYRCSPANATYLAKKCGLSRSSVYTTLNTLTSKGLVGTTYKNEVKQFTAEGIDSLQNFLKDQQQQVQKREEIFSTLQEQITQLGFTDFHIPQIVTFEGQEGLKRIYTAMLREASPKATLYLLRDEFVWQQEWKFIFEEDWHQRVKRWQVEKNIQTKLLINSSDLEQEKQMYYKGRKGLDYRYLPKKKSVHQFAWYLIDDMAAILSMEKNNLVGIQITNQNLVDNFRTIFDLLWVQSKK
ncbi:TPA: hypothetical protein DDZ01_04660 [Candidatus Uhrbacteria bacterium]|nr:MAG: hypothetical protein UT94_C0031G0019 [Candidatus Uhrbacteria bacterium GW2011_GWF2_40_263]OGL97972.1 MAG: hypothetical protein A2332_00525 [Candidatus Uhrbacteria bacterium RIFOXYB2_FULL_41_18]HBK35254.1 hypothetical protein [Candidatus Uhrbacteria bacterium]HCB55721.1 hypothetical protein [Candidatus Uhrbacteria bacterium]